MMSSPSVPTTQGTGVHFDTVEVKKVNLDLVFSDKEKKMPGEISAPKKEEEKDESEDNILEITEAELNARIEEKFLEFVQNEATNPILALSKKLDILKKKFQDSEQECVTLTRFCDGIIKSQEKHLRRNGVLPRAQTRTVGVNVNITYVEKTGTTGPVNPSKVAQLSNDVKPVTPATVDLKTQGNNHSVASANAEIAHSSNVSTPAASNISQEKNQKTVDVIDLTDEDQSVKPKDSSLYKGSIPNTKELSVNKPSDNSRGNNSTSGASAVSGVRVTCPNAISFRPALYNPAARNIVTTQSYPQGQRVAYVVPQPRAVLPNSGVNFQSPRDARPRYASSSVSPTTMSTRPRILSSAGQSRGVNQANSMNFTNRSYSKHPAPLPQQPPYPHSVVLKEPPPKPRLEIRSANKSITLQWNLFLTESHAVIASYQLYGYEETNSAAESSLWKKVGDIKALPLPMACTLTQFQDKKHYYFSVRGVDVHARTGPFSEPVTVYLPNSA